jgi:hypothetical protein
MLTAPSLRRSRAIDLLASRVRGHFENRLNALYVLPDDPYEPSDAPDSIVLVAVLDDDGYNRQRDRQSATEVTAAFELDIDYAYVASLYVASRREVTDQATGPAIAAQTQGVLL